MTTILLARHGESDWNRERRWQGHADRPLTDRGRAQAGALADRLSGVEIAAVYASDLMRAFETARAVATPRGLSVEGRRDLREVDVGSWSGLRQEEIDPAEIERWKAGEKAWDGGESYEEMAARMVRAVSEIAAAFPDRTVLVVSHGGSIRAVHAHALGLPIHEYRLLHPTVSNAGLSVVDIQDGTVSEREIDRVVSPTRRADASSQSAM